MYYLQKTKHVLHVQYTVIPTVLNSRLYYYILIDGYNGFHLDARGLHRRFLYRVRRQPQAAV